MEQKKELMKKKKHRANFKKGRMKQNHIHYTNELEGRGADNDTRRQRDFLPSKK